MISEISSMAFLTTETEVEALLLEQNLIKELKPKYNVLLRDDKSFPYIYLSTHQSFPRLSKHRGGRGKLGKYYGPFSSAPATNRTINQLQKAFLLRTCTDPDFSTRKGHAFCIRLKSVQRHASVILVRKHIVIYATKPINFWPEKIARFRVIWP